MKSWKPVRRGQNSREAHESQVVVLISHEQQTSCFNISMAVRESQILLRCEMIYLWSYVSAEVAHNFMWTDWYQDWQICRGFGVLNLYSQRRREERALQPSLCSPAWPKQFIWPLECLLLQFGLFVQVRALDNRTKKRVSRSSPNLEVNRYFTSKLWGLSHY